MTEAHAAAQLRENLKSQIWRLDNLYKIKDAEGRRIPFRLNWAQRQLAGQLHHFNVILKARQLGISTFFLLYMLDAALFNANHSCGVIAQGLNEAADIFDNKVKFAYDHLLPIIKSSRSLVSDNAKELKFSNGSNLVIGTSMRGGTFQKLLVSEYGKISAKYPEKALEIKTGAFNTVHAGQQIFVESTAEGMQGEFFDLVKLARRIEDEGRGLSPLDPKFHFFPWYQHPGYTLDEIDQRTVTMTKEWADYFASLDVQLTAGQKSWYIKKAAVMLDSMKREFPTTPDEAFSASLEGAYYAKQMQRVRQNGQITRAQHDPRALVHTFWDLGNFDNTAIWFMQHVGREYRMIRYLQASGSDLTHYANELRSFGYSYGNHYLPHDGSRQQLGLKNESVKDFLVGLGIRPITIVPRTNNVTHDIVTKCAPMIERCWFDEVNCAAGIHALDSYRRQWDDRMGRWRDEPMHDTFSDGADAFRTFAVGYAPIREEIYEDDDYEPPNAAGNHLTGY